MDTLSDVIEHPMKPGSEKSKTVNGHSDTNSVNSSKNQGSQPQVNGEISSKEIMENKDCASSSTDIDNSSELIKVSTEELEKSVNKNEKNGESVLSNNSVTVISESRTKDHKINDNEISSPESRECQEKDSSDTVEELVKNNVDVITEEKERSKSPAREKVASPVGDKDEVSHEDTDQGSIEDKNVVSIEKDVVQTSTEMKDASDSKNNDSNADKVDDLNTEVDQCKNEDQKKVDDCNKATKSKKVIAITPKRITRSSTGSCKPSKSYTEAEEEIISEEDDIEITKEVKKTSKQTDDGSDIEMIEESDPLAISDADVKKAKQASKVEKKETNIIVIDTNTLLKTHGSIAAAHTTSKTNKTNIQQISVSIAAAQTSQSGGAVTQIQNAIQAITGGNPAIQGLQSAYLSAIQQVLLAQGGGQVSNPHYLAQLQQYYNTLGALQDDAYVIEAPSFIVPYVMEGKPTESIKDFLIRINKELKDYENKAKEKEENADKEKNDDVSSKDITTEKNNDNEKEVEAKEKKDENPDTGEKSKSGDTEEAKDDGKVGDEKGKTSDNEETIENKDKVKSSNSELDQSQDSNKDDVKTNDDIENKEEDCVKSSSKENVATTSDKENDEKNNGKEDKAKACKTEDDDLENGNKEEDIKIIGKEDLTTTSNKDGEENKENKEEIELVEQVKKNDYSHLGRWESYYHSALGTFFLNLGLDHAQEFLQTDIVKMQKRKLEKMKGNPTKQDMTGLRLLEAQLSVTKKMNSHLHVPMKTCKFCSFKTESKLAMERHLESPHMMNYTYKCNFCDFETRGPQVILFHTEAEHNIRGRLERAPAFFQCALCPYEDNNKSKMTRHSFSCLKKFKSDRNCDLMDWEPPAKIPKIQRGRPNSTFTKAFDSLKMPTILPKTLGLQNLQNAINNSLIGNNSLSARGRGRPVGSYKNIAQALGGRVNQSMLYSNRTGSGSLLQQFPGATSINIANQVLQSVEGNCSTSRVPRIVPASTSNSLILGLAASSSITIQSVQNKTGSNKSPQQPSISITPLPRSGTVTSSGGGKSSTGSRPAFVICEICDGYIKDLEQLRNHMNLIHKVKIHPKMIYNRPPLNCQKCQHRFFTDQGLERHLLGTHGLVTSSMQEAANKCKDAGRCPICGKVFQWKLLNHVSRDHKMILKPAHLSYKCTVCTATFNMYRLFENHVYSAHSVVNKNKNNSDSNSQASSSKKEAPLKINDEITIIPQPLAKSAKSDTSIKSSPKKLESLAMSKEITITKVGSRSSRRNAGSTSVEVISLDDSPSKRQLEDSPKKKARETSKRARLAT